MLFHIHGTLKCLRGHALIKNLTLDRELGTEGGETGKKKVVSCAFIYILYIMWI